MGARPVAWKAVANLISEYPIGSVDKGGFLSSISYRPTLGRAALVLRLLSRAVMGGQPETQASLGAGSIAHLANPSTRLPFLDCLDSSPGLCIHTTLTNGSATCSPSWQPWPQWQQDGFWYHMR